jgi:hypothetical protein
MTGLEQPSNPGDVDTHKYEKFDGDGNKFFNNSGTLIGQVYDDVTGDGRVYVSMRKREKHFHRNHNSFAIDSRTVKNIVNQWPNVETVAIFVIDTNNVLLFDIESYVNAKEDNQRHGYQRFPDQSEAHTFSENAFEFENYYPEELTVDV